MMNFEDLKDSLTVKVVNTENNKDYLADKPTEQIEDMSVVFAAVVKETDEGRMTLPITNEIMESMGVDQQQLKETALANISDQDYSFKSMRDVLVGMMFPDGIPENDPMVDLMLPPEDARTQMYVLSNTQNVNGAAEIRNQKAMDEIAEKLGGDFIVLPSSVHETIVLPINEDMDSKELEGMVQQINAGVVSDEDKLSDHVFQYDSASHELVRMDKMEERKQEKETSIGKTDKSQDDRSEKKADAKTAVKEEKGQKSLKDRISNKQEEVAKKEATREPAAQKSKKMAIG